jgi:hypothetical protein
LEEDFRYFQDILISTGMVITDQNVTEAHARFFISPEDLKDTTLKIEFFRDVPVRIAPSEIYDQVVVDSFDDIAVNKVCTILRRTFEVKDFCDLFFILNRSRYELDYLIGRACEKERAFDEEEGILMFAASLLTVREFQMLPRMIKPLSLEDLRRYFVPIAEELIQRLRPRGG